MGFFVMLTDCLCLSFAVAESGDTASAASAPSNGAAADASATVQAVGDGNQVVFSAELLPSQVLVRLPSKAAADSKQRPLFVVHAIEGFVDALAPLASRLQTPVWGLQCTADAPLDSLQQLAVFYVRQLKTVQATGPYTIAGYSYGAAVAFEMIIELERLGDRAQLVLLDGSPKYVSWFTQEQRERKAGGKGGASVSASEEEALGLAYFGLVCANLNYPQTAKALAQLKTFDARLDAIAALIAKTTKQHSTELVSCGGGTVSPFDRIVANFGHLHFGRFRFGKPRRCFTKNWWPVTATSQSLRPNRMCCCSRPPKHPPNCRRTTDWARYVCTHVFACIRWT